VLHNTGGIIAPTSKKEKRREMIKSMCRGGKGINKREKKSRGGRGANDTKEEDDIMRKAKHR